MSYLQSLWWVQLCSIGLALIGNNVVISSIMVISRVFSRDD